jgi:MoxR-like ATPase
MESGGVRAITEMVRRESAFVDPVLQEVDKVIVGQRTMVERILIGMLTGGHILLEGVPGLAKTLTVNTVARTLRARFQRIQFTPDLLPADLIGTMIYNQHTGAFSTRKGPVFANIVLADEINRAPAKVQSALLEAMQEHQVTIGEETHRLDEPFLVMATQNPIEQEGTYPLPEAQVDRFMLKVKVGYPSKDEELRIMDRVAEGHGPTEVSQVLEPQQLLAARDTLSHIILDEKLKRYIVDIVFATREPATYGLGRLRDLIGWGASPRATIYLALAARAHAFLRHHGYVDPEDIKSVAMDVLRHRVIPTYEAEAEELTSEELIQQILDHVEVP